MGDVIGDLSARRAKVDGMDSQSGGITSVRAFVPLATMFGYATDLRSLTQGRGTFTMEFDHYEQLPADDCRNRRRRQEKKQEHRR